MRILASPDAVEYVREHGGSLYVWADLVNCPRCSVPFLTASTDRPGEPQEFSRFPGEDFDYASKYEWPLTVRDGTFFAEYGAPSAGSPPYDPYEMTPVTGFGLGMDEPFGATRWEF